MTHRRDPALTESVLTIEVATTETPEHIARLVEEYLMSRPASECWAIKVAIVPSPAGLGLDERLRVALKTLRELRDAMVPLPPPPDPRKAARAGTAFISACDLLRAEEALLIAHPSPCRCRRCGALLEAALRRYGAHEPDCARMRWGKTIAKDEPCTCGLDAALASLREQGTA